MTSYKEQLDRTKRWLSKFEATTCHPNSADNQDIVLAFFQNAWHMKDWIKNDDGITKTIRDSIEDKVKKHSALMTCADIANGSKHLSLNRPTRGNPPGGKVVQTMEVIGGQAEKAKQYYEILADDGTRRPAIDLAREILKNWLQILNECGLTQ